MKLLKGTDPTVPGKGGKMSERKFLSYEEAVAMLPEGKKIHTFRNTTGILIGADWTRSQILKVLKKFKPELSGPEATNMNHGIVLFDEVGVLFIETLKT